MVKLIEIRMSYHRKYTHNFNSYGFRIGVAASMGENENQYEAHFVISDYLNKIAIIEIEKIKKLIDQDAEKPNVVQFVGNKCQKCGQDTVNRSFQLCRKCYFEEKEAFKPI